MVLTGVAPSHMGNVCLCHVCVCGVSLRVFGVCHVKSKEFWLWQSFVELFGFGVDWTSRF